VEEKKLKSTDEKMLEKIEKMLEKIEKMKHLMVCKILIEVKLGG
jgi:hypothetical protein